LPRMRWTIPSAAVVLVCGVTIAHAQTRTPMLSFGYRTPTVACNYHGGPTGDDRLPLSVKLPLTDPKSYTAPPALPDSGHFPPGQFFIRKIFVAHIITGGPVTGAYAVVGHSGPNGDWVSPMVIGPNAVGKNSFPADAPVIFAPGEYLDIHAGCTGPATQSAVIAIWYTVPQL